jgi:hypothetical protein
MKNDQMEIGPLEKPLEAEVHTLPCRRGDNAGQRLDSLASHLMAKSR